MSTDDRRAPGATRIPFEALVEVGGALGPSFEAQAIDVSEDGMHLRTAYLPEVGQPLTCRFDAGRGQAVLASGEVVWKQEAGKGGEFGIRFTGLDAPSADALQAMMTGQPPPERPSQAHIQQARGAKVRLHIEGLASPMRAMVKDAAVGKLTAFSGLGFLQVGKHLELEDASTGTKRPAKVVRVECEIDPESRVPQLVMSFQYEDEDAGEDVEVGAAAKERTPEPTVIHDEEPAPRSHAHAASRSEASAEAEEADAIERASGEMRGVVARTATKVTPALYKLMARAKTTIALLAARRAGGGTGEDVAIPLRRKTSPAPMGGLHASGRKVVRDSMPSAKEIPPDAPPMKAWTPKRIGIAAGVVGAAVIGAVMLHKPSAPAVAADGTATTAEGTAAGGPLAATTAEAPLTAPPSVLSPVGSPAAGSGSMAGAMPPATPIGNPTATTAGASEVSSNDVLDEASSGGSSDARPRHRVHVAPFSNGPVPHGNVLRLKMDGPIEKIEGDSQPTGFTVVLPGRRSLEPAAPLAARDGRIGSIRVTNDGSGAELTLAFKDGVPNYLVRAKGDVLEVVLAPTGVMSEARHTTHPTSAPAPATHHRHHRR